MHLDVRQVDTDNAVRRPVVRSKEMPDMAELERHPWDGVVSDAVVPQRDLALSVKQQRMKQELEND